MEQYVTVSGYWKANKVSLIRKKWYVGHRKLEGVKHSSLYSKTKWCHEMYRIKGRKKHYSDLQCGYPSKHMHKYKGASLLFGLC